MRDAAALMTAHADAFNDEKWTDVTDEFFDDHGAIDGGQLIMHDSINLFDAMQAIELMDPKMDSGMVNKSIAPQPMHMVKSGQLPYTEIGNEELIAVFDATLATLVTWLEGNPLAHTVTTNYYMHLVTTQPQPPPNNSDEPTMNEQLRTFLLGILVMMNLAKDTVEQACVAEEEDFNVSQCEFDMRLPVGLPKWFQLLKDVDDLLQKSTRKAKADLQRATPDTAAELEKAGLRVSAIAARFTLLRQLIGALCAMLPVVETSLHKAVKPPSAETAAAAQQKPKDLAPNLAEAERRLHLCEEVLDWCEGSVPLGQQPPDGAADDDFSWLAAFEPDLNRLKLPPSFPRKTKLYTRVEAIVYIRNLVRRLQLVCIALPQRRHNFLQSLSFMRSFSHGRSCVLSRSVLQLVYLPIVEGDQKQDGDLDGSDDDQSSASPVNTAGDAKILGVLSFAQCIADSVRTLVYVPAINSTSPPAPAGTAKQPQQQQQIPAAAAQQAWSLFVDDCCRVLLYVITAAGHNRARQPEKLAHAFKQLAALQQGAESTDVILDEHWTQQQQQASEPSSSQGQKLGIAHHFVLFHVLQSVRDYFELSFELQLLAPFEYSFVYWYLGEVVYRRLAHATDLCSKISIDQINREEERQQREASQQPPGQQQRNAKAQKAQRQKQKKECERLRQIYMRTEQVLQLRTMQTACLALWHVSRVMTLGLEQLGVQRVPRPDDAPLRYSHRMAALQCLQCPLYFTYKQYVQCSRLEMMLARSPESLLGAAAELFNDCRTSLQHLQHMCGAQAAQECDSLARVCKQNAVVSRLLGSGRLVDQRKAVAVAYDFSEHTIIPLIRVTS